MDYSPVQLNDLSDELLLCILNQLNNMDALYSLVGVNQRLDRIVRDVIYTRDVDLMVEPAASALDRFCFDILPRIHHNVECLVLDSSTIERVLLAGSYPRLRKLTLVNLDRAVASRLFTGIKIVRNHEISSAPSSCALDDSPFAHVFKEQILQLVVILPENSGIVPWTEASSNVFYRIINTFSNLTHLDFGCCDPSLSTELSFDGLPANACFSSTLVDLRVDVNAFDDCLRLLDGRLEHLQRFIVEVDIMPHEPPNIDNTVCRARKRPFLSLLLSRNLYPSSSVFR
jgi:hypothetical protein